MTKEVKFIPKYINPIIEEDKTLTVRYGWDEVPEKGEKLLLKNSKNGITFATAKTEYTETLTLQEIVEERWEGHKEYKSLEEIIWSLGHFYDESEMDGDTEVEIIKWHRLNSMY